MHAAPTAQSGLLPAAARRASVPTNNPSADAATPLQGAPTAQSSFVGGGIFYGQTMDERAQPPMHLPEYQPGAMRVTGTLPNEQGLVTGERVFHPAAVMPMFGADHQPESNATYAVSSITMEPPQQSLHQVGVYEQSLMTAHTQENFASNRVHEESVAQQSMPGYPAQLMADRRDSLAAAQTQRVVTGIERVQAGRRESVVTPQLHQNFMSTERMYNEMQTVHAAPQSAQELASRREGVASAFVPQAKHNTDFDGTMTNDVYPVPHSQLQVQTSSRKSLTAPHVQQSLETSAQTSASSRGSFAAPQLQQHDLPDSDHMHYHRAGIAAPHLQQSLPVSEPIQDRREEIAAPQAQPQPRQSRLSRDAQPQGELLQTKAASLPPLAARSSHAAVRRASAPTHALPDIPEEPPATLGSSLSGKLFSTVRAAPS